MYHAFRGSTLVFELHDELFCAGVKGKIAAPPIISNVIDFIGFM